VVVASLLAVAVVTLRCKLESAIIFLSIKINNVKCRFKKNVIKSRCKGSGFLQAPQSHTDGILHTTCLVCKKNHYRISIRTDKNGIREIFFAKTLLFPKYLCIFATASARYGNDVLWGGRS
jgi:hypothetical protein